VEGARHGLGESGLIVTCEACTTSFQLDEARIPAGGARVRCSRCKHAFLLPHPSDSSPEALHRIAADTAADASPGVPPASADLPPERSGAEPGRSSATSEPDEEDWQFNAEVRIPGDDDADAEEESDFDAGADFGEGFDDTASPVDEGAGRIASSADAEGDRAPSIAEDARDESSFGSVDDFSSWMEDEEAVDPGSKAPEMEGGARELGGDDAEVGVYSSRGGAEDLGDPESWDLIGSAAPTSFQRSTAATSGSARPGDARTPLASTPDLLDPFGQPVFADDLEERGPLRTAALRIAHTLGWGVTLALIAAASFALLQPEWARRSGVAQRAEAGAFVAETRQTSWMETSRMGALLLVRGRSSNAGAEPLWPQPVRIALLDGAGTPLTVAPVGAGTLLPESVLRESQPETLEAARRRAISAFLSEPLAPGESRAFEAIVTDVPAQARRILLEIAGPEPRPEPPPGETGGALALSGPEAASAPVAQLGGVEESFEASP